MGAYYKIWKHKMLVWHAYLHYIDIKVVWSKRGVIDPIGTFILNNRNKAMAKKDKDKQTKIVHKTQHRKIKTKQHEPHKNM